MERKSSSFKQNRKYLFIFKCLPWVIKGFYLRFFFFRGGGELHFLKDNLYLYGYKLTNKVAYLTWYRNQLQCALMMNVSSDAVFVWFHLIFLLCCLVCSVFFFFSSLLDFSALKRICTKGVE